MKHEFDGKVVRIELSEIPLGIDAHVQCGSSTLGVFFNMSEEHDFEVGEKVKIILENTK